MEGDRRGYVFKKKVFLTDCNEEDSTDDCEEGSSEAAREGHLGMAGLQLRDLGHIGQRLVSERPTQPTHTHTHTLSKAIGCDACDQHEYEHPALPYADVLACPDDPLQGRFNEALKLLILSLNRKTRGTDERKRTNQIPP